MKKVNVGIDLGTTYSAVASFSKEAGRVQVYKNSFSKECTPSVVCIENKNVMIGDEAKDEQKSGNVNTVAFYKSMMGDVNYNAYIDGKEYSAEDLSGIFLKNLVKDIQDSNDVEIEGAVITVPAYFNEKQREATIRAGQKAGLKVLKIINEPTAAIIAYGLTSGQEKNVMVYDLGGGTFDVTIAHVKGTQIVPLATNGNHQLGGKDWDQVLIDDIKEKFYSEYEVNIDNHEEDLKELQVKCEEAKKRLSNLSTTSVSIQCEGFLGKYDVSREDFDSKTYSLLYETVLLINSCFDEISEKTGKSFGWSDIDEVVLVGGSTRMPQVKDMIIKEYGKPPITKDINVDTIVATGAAMQAELCVSNTITLTVANNKATSVPNSASAKSAPATMTLTIKNADIQDITSHGLGMLALAKDEKSYINSIIIRKNSKVNETFSREYTFSGDNLEVYVLQGESRDPYECDIIGKYSITGMKKGDKNNIVVNFLYNSNGVVEVNACIKGGKVLSAKREAVTEDMDAIIARLEKEREEAKKNRVKIEIMLAIDTSGSMCGERIINARRSAKEFIDQFDLKNTSISIIAFADRSGFACKWSKNKKELYSAIDNIENVLVGGGTSAQPIRDNYIQFSRDAIRIMVILTDGYWSNQAPEIEAASAAKKSGIIMYGIGIGEANEDFLNKISSGAGKKVDLSQLTATFKEVASSIATEVASNSLK